MKIGISKNYLKMKVLKIRNLEKYLEMEVLKIGILKNYLRMRFLKNWNFGKLNFEMGVLTIKFENWNFEKLNFNIKRWRIKKRMRCGSWDCMPKVAMHEWGPGFRKSFIIAASTCTVKKLLSTRRETLGYFHALL